MDGEYKKKEAVEMQWGRFFPFPRQGEIHPFQFFFRMTGLRALLPDSSGMGRQSPSFFPFRKFHFPVRMSAC